MNLAIILVITNFLRTLVVILIIWYGIKFVTRYIFPMLVSKTVKNMQSRMEEQLRQQRPGRPEGEVTIEKNRNQSRSNNSVGEYVDFEEVK
jgi:hypothetical protein